MKLVTAVAVKQRALSEIILFGRLTGSITFPCTNFRTSSAVASLTDISRGQPLTGSTQIRIYLFKLEGFSKRSRKVNGETLKQIGDWKFQLQLVLSDGLELLASIKTLHKFDGALMEARPPKSVHYKRLRRNQVPVTNSIAEGP